MKNLQTSLILAIIFACVSFASTRAQQISQSGLNFTHGGGEAPYALSITNYDLQNTGNTMYLTSSLGGGMQAAFTPKQNVVASILPNIAGNVECQSPLGNQVSCLPGNVCQSATAQYCFSLSPGTGTCYPRTGVDYLCLGTNNLYIANVNNKNQKSQDALNELQNAQYKGGTASLNAALNNVFLDTIVNRTATSYIVATTTAPLFIAGSQQGTAAPTSIAGALDAGDLSLHDSIYNVDHTKTGSITLGGNTYPVNFLTSADYVIKGGNPQYPFIKKHMAQPTLALSTDLDNGNQTIILFPSNWQYNCQPAILIGKKQDDGTLLAVTYLANYATQDTGQQCCVTSTGSCAHDALYPTGNQPAPWSTLELNFASSPQVANFGSNKPLGGSTSGVLTPGRMKIVIDSLDANNCSNTYGYVSTLTILPGLYYPGGTDFPATPQCLGSAQGGSCPSGSSLNASNNACCMPGTPQCVGQAQASICPAGTAVCAGQKQAAQCPAGSLYDSSNNSCCSGTQINTINNTCCPQGQVFSGGSLMGTPVGTCCPPGQSFFIDIYTGGITCH